MRTAAAAFWAAALVACGSAPPIARVLSGELAVGPTIASDAYAAFLMGALAEEDGRLELAALAYRSAARKDGAYAEPLARFALVRCRANVVQEGHEAALHVLQGDPTNATAYEALAVCAFAAGGAARGRQALGIAAHEDPRNDELARLLASRQADAGDMGGARLVLEGALLSRPTQPGLRMTAAELAHRAGRPMRAAELAASAVSLSSTFALRATRLTTDLLAAGQLHEARALASALVDLGPVGSGGHGRVATTLGEPMLFALAIDEALLRGDAEKAAARATKGGVGLGEVVGRAILLGALGPARELLGPLKEASAVDAAVARLALGDAVNVPAVRDAPANALLVALQKRGRASLDGDSAATFLASFPKPAIDARDALLVNATR